MYIKFANTDGQVFQSASDQSLNIGYQPLGTVLTLDEGIIIVDRDPTQLTSQLEMSYMIYSLTRALQKMYPLQAGLVFIYLPKMRSNMAEQAKCQYLFQNLFVASKKSNVHFNINLIHV